MPNNQGGTVPSVNEVYPNERERTQIPSHGIPTAERLRVMEERISTLFELHEEVVQRRINVIASELGIKF